MRQNDFTVRTYHPDDFDSFVRLRIDTEKHDHSGHHCSKQRLAEELGHPSFQPEDNLFVAERDANLIGFVSVFLEPAIERALLDGLVHPLQRRKGIATELFAHAIGHARNAGLKQAQICIAQTNQAAGRLMKRLGFDFIRRFIGMELDLTTRPLPDIKPDNYTIRHLQPGEAQTLTDIQNRSFADAWGFHPNTREEIAYRINSSTCSAEDILMAFRGDDPIGYCWTRILAGENDATGSITGEIHMLGVDPDFRKQGVGRNLLLAGLAHLENKGITRIELTTDGEDPVAWGLYESTGFEESMILQWYQKKLIPQSSMKIDQTLNL